MKKLLSILICISIFVLMLSACGSTEKKEDTGESEKTASVSKNESNSEEETDSDESKTDVLVVVFSATGTTKGVAEMIASLTDADLKEIIPAEPYSSDDLNYGNSDSRATREQNDADARPKIKEEISLEGYKTVFLGYPIWWGQAPRIMSTFVEGHDFSGITVIPFCTSRSSDIGQSDDTLASQAGTGNWLQGKRFPGSVSEDQLREWIGETGAKKMEKEIQLYIGEKDVTVNWEDNDSVKELKKLVSSKSLTIKMSEYGGFEQVGPLGTTLPRDDSQITTGYGDLVLYSGNQIVIFYGSNSWSYTKLGHIALSKQELTEMLSGENITITIKKA